MGSDVTEVPFKYHKEGGTLFYFNYLPLYEYRQ